MSLAMPGFGAGKAGAYIDDAAEAGSKYYDDLIEYWRSQLNNGGKAASGVADDAVAYADDLVYNGENWIKPDINKITSDTSNYLASNLEPHESQIIDELIEKGNDIEIIPRSNIQNIKTYDVKVNGIPTEFKTLFGCNTGTGAKRIYEGFIQGADTVILDGRKSGLTIQQAKEIINRAAGKYLSKQIPGKVQIWTIDGILTYP